VRKIAQTKRNTLRGHLRVMQIGSIGLKRRKKLTSRPDAKDVDCMLYGSDVNE
jgi:hypothetical protein